MMLRLRALSLKKRGRPAHVPTVATRRQVIEFSAMGLTQMQISKLLGISSVTLVKSYREELDTAEARALFNVANNLYNIATDPTNKSSAAAAMFWMKTRGGWREKNRLDEMEQKAIETAEGSGKPQQVLDPRLLTVEQRQALREIVTVAAQAMMGNGQAAIEHQGDDDEGDDGDYDDSDDGDDGGNEVNETTE